MNSLATATAGASKATISPSVAVAGSSNSPQAGRKPSVASELRIGLAMSGAIALVLYEAGVTHELYRFLKAWESFSTTAPQAVPDLPDYDGLCDDENLPELFRSRPNGYFEAFEKIPIRPVVDILTGASAGGINSVFLASCIATGQDFGDFHDVWIDSAGIENLQYRTSVPKSLLDSDPLGRAARKKLVENAGRAPANAGAPVDLRVRLCRTHLKGHCLTTQDALGHTLDVETKANIIEFETEHFRSANEEQITKLVNAALATSAFPGAFKAIKDEGRWYIDGGLWDNQPIDLAVEAIRDKPAFSRTHRCILFVEPNPTNISKNEEPHSDSNPEPEPPFAQTLVGIAFMGIKGNVWPALVDVLDHNRRSNLFSALLQEDKLISCASDFGCRQLKESFGQLRKVATLTAARVGQWNIIGRWNGKQAGAGVFVPTLLNQIRLEELLFGGSAGTIRQWTSLLEQLGYNPRTKKDSTPIARVALLAALRSLQAIGAYDLELQALRTELDKLNQELAGFSRAGLSDATREIRKRRRRKIAALKAVYYARIEQINYYLSPFRNPDHRGSKFASVTKADDGSHAVARSIDAAHEKFCFQCSSASMLHDIEEIYKELRIALKDENGERTEQELQAIEASVMTRIQKRLHRWSRRIEHVASRARAGVDEFPVVIDGLHIRSRFNATSQYNAIALYHQQMQAEEKEVRRPQDRLYRRDALREVVEKLRAKRSEKVQRGGPLLRHNCLGAARYILSAVSDLIDKSRIDLVRISPNDTSNLHLIPSYRHAADKSAAVQKLAGEGLGHLTGFLESRWRRNDYVWGRLDACEILLRALRSFGEREELYLVPRGNDVSDAVHKQQNEREYERVLVKAQTAILQQEAALYKAWLKEHGHRDDKLQARQLGGVKRVASAAEEQQEAEEKQKANDRLIGFGHETIQDADEPAFTKNVNYLVQTSIRLAQGDADKPPALLDKVARATRLLSYPMRLLAATTPVSGDRTNPSMRSIWKLMGVVLLLMLAAYSFGANNLFLIMYGAIAATFFIACGCGLGFRLWTVVPGSAFLGLFVGYLVSKFLPVYLKVPYFGLKPRIDVLGLIAGIGLFACLIDIFLAKQSWLKRPLFSRRTQKKSMSP